ncbi:cysteine dioxygenase [Streptomyces sp. BE303]|uniref:cysteine dioxygenase n=1 Tax=Streptomyces sp. BE303 TaxID=3002528 RepID=UPI002E79FF7B|nr:cysteine dioxygenase family protein [Streptomyces sp. BE303]MED7951874.1 cysteine dioxygenase family protein [Streptomyces sp. BE303]
MSLDLATDTLASAVPVASAAATSAAASPATASPAASAPGAPVTGAPVTGTSTAGADAPGASATGRATGTAAPTGSGTVVTEEGRVPLTPSALRAVVRELAEQPDQWIHHVRLSTEERWYRRLVADDDHEVWLISWLPGQSTGFHDHGGSRGAFTVALGELEELSLGGPEQGLLIRRIQSGTTRAFGPEYVHDVRNTASGPAVTLHAYSPPLSSMAHYELRAGGLVRTSEEGPEQW